MSRADELEDLRAVAAGIGLTVEPVEGGFALASTKAGTFVSPTLAGVALVIGALMAVAPEIKTAAAAAAALARYGISPAGNRAQRRAQQHRKGGRHG